MFRKMARFAIKLGYAVIDVFLVRFMKRYPIVYFDSVPNVGDLINPYLVERISGRKAHNVRSKMVRHVVGLGSMFHMANSNSVIWGTGIISGDIGFRKMIKCQSVNAVRGHLTKNILLEEGIISSGNLPIGDPGLLMPNFYNPRVMKQYKVGIIPHYVDIDHGILKTIECAIVIDVRQDPESFIDELLKCECVISSSLHGLILADSYGVPNKWVSFSDNITGGNFKFHDYYSTTDNRDEHCIVCSDEEIFKDLVYNIDRYTSVKRFIFDKEKLIESFPVF